MGTPASHAVAGLAGAAVAVTVMLASAGLSPEQPPVPMSPAAEGMVPVVQDEGADASPAGRSDGEDSATAALADRIAALQASVAALDRKLDHALAERARAPVTAPAGAADVFVDESMLQRAIESAQANAERAKLRAMTPGEAIQTARDLLYDKKDHVGARRVLEALLDRPLEPAQRQQALVQLGISQRSGEDNAASAATLQQAIDLAGGPDTELGAQAAFQLAWTELGRGDRRRARELFEQLGRCEAAGRVRLEGRWNAAKLAAADGDPRARAEFEAILRECTNERGVDHIVADLRARLGSR